MIVVRTVTKDIAPLNNLRLISFTAIIFKYSLRLRFKVEVATILVLLYTILQSLISIVVFEICFKL
jgi:hypothetical protein